MIVLVAPVGFGPGTALGGAERYALELGRALSRRRRVRLVTFTTGEDVGVHQDASGLEWHRHRAAFFLRGKRINPVSLGFLRSLRDARLIHVHQFNTICGNLSHLAARALGVPIFYTDHSGGGWNLNVLMRLLARGDGVLTVSRFSAEYLRECHGAPVARTRVVYGGVDPAHYPYEAPAERERTAVFLGRLVPHKGVEVLLRGLPEGWRAEIIGGTGDPEYRARLEEEAAGRPVEFVVGASDEEVRRRLRSASALVLPTRPLGRRPELLGLVLIEAQALGTPVVATRVGALSEVIEDGVTGRLVPPDDPAALGRALVDLEDPARRLALAGAARAQVEERFTWARCAEACLEAYAELGAA